MGATVLSTENEEPTVFDEEFTGTISWMFAKKSVPLPQDGKYYMVTYIPSGGEGKFWVAPGDAEAFGLWDIVRMPVIVVQARSFHEIFPWGGILGWAYLLIIALLLGGLAGLAFLLRWAVRKSVRHRTRCCAGQSR
jgi:presenilin-like A22 family membrane protease